MRFIKPSYEILTPIDGKEILQHLEKIGRVCYKSEERITDTSHMDFIKMIIKNGHEAMIEHFSFGVKFICNRGVTHELVRHRLASWAQESTRYCNYGKLGVTFIIPSWMNEHDSNILLNQGSVVLKGLSNLDESMLSPQAMKWAKFMSESADCYEELLDMGLSPQHARGVLPNDLKTEIIMTANLREWRHFFKLRSPISAHPDMRQLVNPLLSDIKTKIPLIFDDIKGVV